MKRWIALLAFLALLCPSNAGAHLGSPDVFYDGLVGPYATHVTIRMPGVVPGRAEISVQVRSDETVAVDFAPIASRTAVSNTPPAEAAQHVTGETNLFSGELWLMVSGAYSIAIHVRGNSGEGTVQIPINSVATHQLPLPRYLGGTLVALGLILFCGGIAIIAAAASESVLPPGVAPAAAVRRKYWKAAAISAFVFVVLLVGGKRWWNSEEAEYHTRLREGGWPDLAANVRFNGSQRILRLTVGKEDLKNDEYLALAPDHGKLLHTFLARLPNHETFAHLHPVRAGDKKFDVALPPLPEGDYKVLCDLTLEKSGVSSTATNIVHIPAVSETSTTTNSMKIDPDDSWAADAAVAVRDNAAGDTVCHLPDGKEVIWKAHPALRVLKDAGLRFEVQDEAGQPATLEPYMGMMSHAAVLRSDGRVFSHLHPSGNYSMAAQMFFDAKIGKESKVAGKGIGTEVFCGPIGTSGDHSLQAHHAGVGSSVINLPYEFPTAGDYRLWVQIKTGGRIMTAIFDTTVL